VRGGFPEPWFLSLPGMEQARRAMRGLVLPFPVHHLVGHRLTQVGSGTATATMVASPWLQTVDGTVDFRILMEAALYFAVLTGAPPGSEVQASALAINHMRPCTVESETLVARARTLNSGPTFTLAEVLVEDAQGRGVAHGTGTYVIRAVQPPPLPDVGSDAAVERPIYATADPWERPLSWSPRDVMFDEISALEIFQRTITGQLAYVPLQELLGVRIIDAREGSVILAMEASDWLASQTRQVAPGVIASFAWHASAGAMATLAPVGHRLAVLNQTVAFLSPVSTDGRELIARGTVTHRRAEALLSTAELTDTDGNVVAVGHQTSLLMPRRRRGLARVEPQRVLATVLFTDIVGSTERAQEMGDAPWNALLEEHHGIVRKQLQVFKGREVKTTGDGFLATFDSPGRGVQCARAIRDGVRPLGLKLRAGLHTGECEVSAGDVAGIAIHVASRIQSAAQPGEILVSSTVRDLIAGSGLQLFDRGVHELKGVKGKWQLFAADS
jgi:uncharacterized protein (TIGR00369 family)